MIDRETANILRGMITVGVISNVRDDGETQTATIEWADGIVRDDVEVLQPFGFGSVPDEDGAIALAIGIGGDQGHVVVLPIGNPSGRVGGLAPGEAGLYARQGGARVHLKNDGSAEVEGAKQVRARIGQGQAAPRFAADADHVKLRKGNDWIVVMDGQIRVSRNPVIAPDPKPEV